MALAAYAIQYSISQMTTNQLDLVDEIIAALSPIEAITKAVSADCVSVSFCRIPTIGNSRGNKQGSCKTQLLSQENSMPTTQNCGTSMYF